MNNHQSLFLSRGFTHGDSSFVRSMSNAECMCHIYLLIAKHERSTTAEDAAHWSWAKVSSFSCHAILIAYANTCSIIRFLFITHYSYTFTGLDSNRKTEGIGYSNQSRQVSYLRRCVICDHFRIPHS